MLLHVGFHAGEVKMSGAGGAKRPSGGDSPPGPPEKKSKKEEKTTTTLIEPIRIGGVSSTVSPTTFANLPALELSMLKPPLFDV